MAVATSNSKEVLLKLINAIQSNLKNVRQNPQNSQFIDVVENDVIKVKQTLDKFVNDTNTSTKPIDTETDIDIDAKIAEMKENEIDSLLNDIEKDASTINYDSHKKVSHIIEKPVEQPFFCFFFICLSLHKSFLMRDQSSDAQ